MRIGHERLSSLTLFHAWNHIDNFCDFVATHCCILQMCMYKVSFAFLHVFCPHLSPLYWFTEITTFLGPLIGESCSVEKELDANNVTNAVYQDKTNILFSVKSWKLLRYSFHSRSFMFILMILELSMHVNVRLWLWHICAYSRRRSIICFSFMLVFAVNLLHNLVKLLHVLKHGNINIPFLKQSECS